MMVDVVLNLSQLMSDPSSRFDNLRYNAFNNPPDTLIARHKAISFLFVVVEHCDKRRFRLLYDRQLDFSSNSNRSSSLAFFNAEPS